ncbi:MAG: hypothetical protein QW303_01025, partial [Nitrososphaerota archaeon]
MHLIGLLFLYNDADQSKRGRPYVYPTAVILRCFVVRRWFRIPSNNALWYYFLVIVNLLCIILKLLHPLTKRLRSRWVWSRGRRYYVLAKLDPVKVSW